MESKFCSLCSQIVINQSMASQALNKDHFARVMRFVKRFSHFCNCLIFLFTEKIKNRTKAPEIIMKPLKFT